MNYISRGYTTGLVLAGTLALVVGATSAAAQQTQMRFEGLFGTLLVEDSDTNNNVSGVADRITFNLDSDDAGVLIGLGLTAFNFTGGLCPQCPTRLDLNTGELTSTGLVGPFSITVTRTGFTLPTALPFIGQLAYSGNVSGNTVVTTGWWDPDNELFGDTRLIASTTQTGSYGGDIFTVEDAASPFSLTLRMEFTNGIASGGIRGGGDVRLTPIPVPAALPLLLGGLGVLGLVGLRRRSSQAA